MARMHSRRKGKSGSTKPVKKTKPSWLRYTSKEIEQLIIKLAKAGNSPAKIGLTLRDSYGIPCVKTATKKKILKILAENKISPKLPSDLTALIKKHIALMKHEETNKKDQPSKLGLQLTESKIHRLAKYYMKKGTLPRAWFYDKSRAKLLIE